MAPRVPATVHSSGLHWAPRALPAARSSHTDPIPTLSFTPCGHFLPQAQLQPHHCPGPNVPRLPRLPESVRTPQPSLPSRLTLFVLLQPSLRFPQKPALPAACAAAPAGPSTSLPVSLLPLRPSLVHSQCTGSPSRLSLCPGAQQSGSAFPQEEALQLHGGLQRQS